MGIGSSFQAEGGATKMMSGSGGPASPASHDPQSKTPSQPLEIVPHAAASTHDRRVQLPTPHRWEPAAPHVIAPPQVPHSTDPPQPSGKRPQAAPTSEQANAAQASTKPPSIAAGADAAENGASKSKVQDTTSVATHAARPSAATRATRETLGSGRRNPSEGVQGAACRLSTARDDAFPNAPVPRLSPDTAEFLHNLPIPRNLC